MIMAKNERKYLVVQRIGSKDEFVWDEDATNTAVDCPNGEDDFLTKEEAEQLLAALKANAEKKGWDNVQYFVDEMEPTMTLQEAVNELRAIQDKVVTMVDTAMQISCSTMTSDLYWCVYVFAQSKRKHWFFSEDCADEFARQINEIKNFLNL